MPAPAASACARRRGDRAHRRTRRPRRRSPPGARLRTGRGALPEHPHAAQRPALRRHRRRPRGQPRPDRPAHHQAAWLLQRFAEIRALDNDAARRTAIDEILNWTNPGPGGFYDDLGDPANRPHLLPGVGFDKDPAFFHTVRTGFGSRRNTPWRVSWYRHAEVPLRQLHSTALLRPRPVRPLQSALHPVRRHTPRATRLVANGKIEIHPMRKKDLEVKPVEFDIPAEATAGGTLTLEWQAEPRRIRQRPLRPNRRSLADPQVRQASRPVSSCSLTKRKAIRPPSTRLHQNFKAGRSIFRQLRIDLKETHEARASPANATGTGVPPTKTCGSTTVRASGRPGAATPSCTGGSVAPRPVR